ncbi:MAG: hypothetical protein BMS9Abin36_2101 [Gammaproteobacteria bacterium]|nr:MAG: hypothetical protein BMS9Abin36_2101 [Gammaproteobacteria bacterium]
MTFQVNDVDRVLEVFQSPGLCMFDILVSDGLL